MESVWDYPRPPRLERTDAIVTITHAGVPLVRSTRCWRVLETSHPPVYYVPRSDIAAGALVQAPGRSYCEFKGDATYWTLTEGGAPVAWSYQNPTPAYAELVGAVAFYPSRVDECTVNGVVVQPQEGDFYGGWITPDITGPFKGPPGTRGW
ncbi:DUF427 domain-containing protein [Actinoplanes awajinensis]|uniref:DUF427 domain-containing protein n=1 Tax=Actinoplanes awajinensis subsp. mycoplanecinus TaxID=135947 RepID=A0A0X3VBP3_9ACTN|nr:DUF427 domain-containing protein [Actinoplanes awajinensis]KUL41837.1 hypothetical protein ADL15_03025 [Actinoplanes awajinensis subsp. mycoplanecinus]